MKKKKNHTVKKFQLWGKFIFRQLVMNFNDFQRNNCVFLNIAN